MSDAVSTEEQDLYYLQTKGYSGDSYLWWRLGKHGYTADIKQAHVFTKAEAFAQHECRPHQDIPWRKDFIDANVQFHVSSERVRRTMAGAV